MGIKVRLILICELIKRPVNPEITFFLVALNCSAIAYLLLAITVEIFVHKGAIFF
jgi:hypothetical protein